MKKIILALLLFFNLNGVFASSNKDPSVKYYHRALGAFDVAINSEESVERRNNAESGLLKVFAEFPHYKEPVIMAYKKEKEIIKEKQKNKEPNTRSMERLLQIGSKLGIE